MRVILFLASFLASFVLLLVKPAETLAQTCIGNSGGEGQCVATMNCAPPIRIDGDCDEWPLICCLNEMPPSGALDCSDICMCSPGDNCDYGETCRYNTFCASTPTGNICYSPENCPVCLGLQTGTWGTCLSPTVCDGKQLTVESSPDCSAQGFGGTDCCTNAPSFDVCQIEALPPFLTGADFSVVLVTSAPSGSRFRISTSPYESCAGTCAEVEISEGYAVCTLACAPAGTYTITARRGSTSCSTTVGVITAPGPPCVGATSGLDGWCVALFCPADTIPDGGYPNQCTDHEEQRCCVPTEDFFTDPAASPAAVFCDADGNPTDEPGDNPRLYTAIGCIPIGSNTEFAGFFLGWSLGIGGGIAFILIVYAGFLIITSAGNPQRLQAGKELLTSSLAGLLLIVFSVFILRIITIDVLRIPGF